MKLIKKNTFLNTEVKRDGKDNDPLRACNGDGSSTIITKTISMDQGYFLPAYTLCVHIAG